MTKHRILLADDQALVREGLRSLLEMSGKVLVAAEANDGEECIQILTQKSADIDLVLLDIRMPIATGLDVLRFMQTHSLDTPAIILTTFDDHEYIIEGMKLGAKGYLLKDISLEKLVEAIERVLEGEIALQPLITERIINGISSKENANAAPSIETLTNKELDILRLASKGLNNKEIALSLHNSEGTIKNHFSNLLAKLNARDRTQAVVKALELGIL